MKKQIQKPQKEKITIKDILNWVVPIVVSLLTLLKAYLELGHL